METAPVADCIPAIVIKPPPVIVDPKLNAAHNPPETAPPNMKEGITRNGSDKANGIAPSVIPNDDKIHDIFPTSFSYWFEKRRPISVTNAVVQPVPIPAAQKQAYGTNNAGLVNYPLVKACENDANEKAHAILLNGPHKSKTHIIPIIIPNKAAKLDVCKVVNPLKITLINKAIGCPITNKITHILINAPKNG